MTETDRITEKQLSLFSKKKMKQFIDFTKIISPEIVKPMNNYDRRNRPAY
jgi:RAB protein geranylgeranyltransferase component A